MYKYEKINFENSEEILMVIAYNNSEYDLFLDENKLREGINEIIPLPLTLADDTLVVLRENQKINTEIESLKKSHKGINSFATGGEITALLAVVFVLRTHIKLERTTTKKWKLLIEHKPTDSKLLSEILKKLEKWWNINV